MTDQAAHQMIIPETVPVPEEVLNRIGYLHIGQGLSWRKITDQPEFKGIPHSTLATIFQRGQISIHSPYLEILGVPRMVPVPVCKKCGLAHQPKRCTTITTKPADADQVEMDLLEEVGSKIERQFISFAHERNLPDPVREFKFHPERDWRFDFAWPPLKISVEMEGGIWSRGRHVRGKGYENDCEKYNEAILLGWLILRFTSRMLRDGRGDKQLLEAFDGNNNDTFTISDHFLTARGKAICPTGNGSVISGCAAD